MRRRKERFVVIWSAYFDIERSRGLGRKVPKSLAVRNPTVDDISRALSELNIRHEVYPDKRFPRTWYLDSAQGYVIAYVSPGVRKRQLLRMIGEKLRGLRSAK